MLQYETDQKTGCKIFLKKRKPDRDVARVNARLFIARLLKHAREDGIEGGYAKPAAGLQGRADQREAVLKAPASFRRRLAN